MKYKRNEDTSKELNHNSHWTKFRDINQLDSACRRDAKIQNSETIIKLYTEWTD
jgi:hypothetical protein